MTELEQVLTALQKLRVPQALPEADLQRMTYDCLKASGIDCAREVRLGPRCRIDILTAGGIGIELKKERPDRDRLLEQLTRYAGSEAVTALVVISQRSVRLPGTLLGKPCAAVSLNSLWGVAL